MVWVCFRSPYARSDGGLAKPFAENLTTREVIISSASALVIGLLLCGVEGMMIFLGIGLFTLAIRLFFLRTLKGITGDVLGAANELSELLCLILLIIFK